MDPSAAAPQIRKVVALGMDPYPWDYPDLADTVRLMTRYWIGMRRLFINPPAGFRRARAQATPMTLAWRLQSRGDVVVATPPLEPLPGLPGLRQLRAVWRGRTLPGVVASVLGKSWREDTLFYCSSAGIRASHQALRTLAPRWSVLDVLDDNLAFPGLSALERADLSSRFAALARRVTVVVAVSEPLVRRLRDTYGIRAVWLPNALDLEAFTPRADFDAPLPELAGLPRPMVGFVGALTNWLDYELLWKIAGSPRGFTLVSAGPVLPGQIPAPWLDRLRRHPRVAFLGPVPYAQVGHLLHQMDLLILPRNYAPHSLASDPLKLYEYLATGKPVLSTAIPAAARFASSVQVASDHTQFLAALESWEEWAPRKTWPPLEDLSWARRCRAVLELVYAASPRHG